MASKESVKIAFNDDLSANLQNFADKVKGTFKEASFKAATVLYDEMKIRAPEGPTGNLQASIYRYRLKVQFFPSF